MNYVNLTPEQRQAVCEDLLTIEAAGCWEAMVSLRLRLLREHRPPTVWQQIDEDRLANAASRLIGGTPNYWRSAAAAALGIRSRSDVCIEAVCHVADDVRWQEREPEPAPEPSREKPRYRATLGSRKRGGR
jgi:hypothetical protein